LGGSQPAGQIQTLQRPSEYLDDCVTLLKYCDIFKWITIQHKKIGALPRLNRSCFMLEVKGPRGIPRASNDGIVWSETGLDKEFKLNSIIAVPHRSIVICADGQSHAHVSRECHRPSMHRQPSTRSLYATSEHSISLPFRGDPIKDGQRWDKNYSGFGNLCKQLSVWFLHHPVLYGIDFCRNGHLNRGTTHAMGRYRDAHPVGLIHHRLDLLP
jgi:hypothetical protein